VTHEEFETRFGEIFDQILAYADAAPINARAAMASSAHLVRHLSDEDQQWLAAVAVERIPGARKPAPSHPLVQVLVPPQPA
jgi:hypothetical protein